MIGSTRSRVRMSLSSTELEVLPHRAIQAHKRVIQDEQAQGMT